MFSNIPTWLRAIFIFLSLTVLYLVLAWIALQIDTQPKPQVLPVLARIQAAGQIIYLEMPQTPDQQIQGFMYRTIIPRSRGILFEITPPKIAELSMQNMLVSVDMIFLKDEQINLIRLAVPTCNQNICPTYSSNTVVDQVIELAATRTLELGLKIGDRLPIQFLPPLPTIYK